MKLSDCWIELKYVLIIFVGTDADIDTGYDDVEDYDENAVVRRKKHIQL